MQTDLVKQLLYKLNKDLKDPHLESQDKDKIVRLVNVLDHLLPYILFYVINDEKIINNIEKHMAIELSMFRNN